MRTLKVNVTIEYEIEIDDNNYIVQEYLNDNQLIDHLISYRFSDVLPVISEGGVNIVDSTIVEDDFYEV